MGFSLKNLSVFLWVNFQHFGDRKKKSSATKSKGILLKMMCQSHQILMNKFLKSPYLDNRFQHTLAKYSKILKLFLLSSLTHSHIWLIPCMDNCQCGYKKLIIIIIFIFIFIYLLKLCLGYVSYNTKGNNLLQND
jgi:hypothetical protein